MNRPTSPDADDRPEVDHQPPDICQGALSLLVWIDRGYNHYAILSGIMLNVDNRTIFQADNIDVLRGLNSQSVDLVYLDPPFNKNDTFVSGDSKRVREIKEFFIDKQAQGEFKGVDFDEVFKDDRAAFKDIWSRNDLNEEYYQQINDHDSRLITYIDSVKDSTPPGGFYYLIYMTVRLIEIKRVLKDSGSLYLHCDPTFSHYLKGLLDLLLGVDNFRNEIVWCYTQLGGSLKAFPKKHDYLLFYSKSPSYTFNRQFIPYKKSNKSSGVYKFKNLTPEQQAKVETIDKRGKSVESWWIDLPIVNSQAKERMGYPTQKPLKLLERIILASSREGDIVLDPFCGCATTCLAAEKLDRQWLGIDKNPQTYYMIYYRAYQSGLLGTKDKPSLLSNTLIQTTKIPSRTDLSAVDKRYQKQLAINLKQAKKLQAAKDSRSKLTTRDRSTGYKQPLWSAGWVLPGL